MLDLFILRSQVFLVRADWLRPQKAMAPPIVGHCGQWGSSHFRGVILMRYHFLHNIIWGYFNAFKVEKCISNKINKLFLDWSWHLKGNGMNGEDPLMVLYFVIRLLASGWSPATVPGDTNSPRELQISLRETDRVCRRNGTTFTTDRPWSMHRSTGRRDGEEMWNCDEFAVSQCIVNVCQFG